MTFVQQEVWHWQIATYLFLGGLGGATFSIGAILHLFQGVNKKMLSIAIASALGFLVIGTIFLLADMLQPMKAIYALTNPNSWIFWGVIFINIYFLAAIAYLIPLLEVWPPLLPFIQKIPQPLLSLLERYNRLAALGGAAAGFLVAIYTGLLISAAPAITFWNTPALPLLFVVSGFSTGAAFLLLLTTFWDDDTSHQVAATLEQLDAILIISELIVLGAYFNFALFLPTGARESAEFLFHSPIFLIGFFIFGLIIPLALETYAIFFAKHSKKSLTLLRLASILILLGGYLLRIYVLQAGFYQYPW
uniref:Polysulfide reductase, subunit C, putative n=1 Tax=Chlorobium chlorochromatii (strain CaD3) TaxID=340177 RepID=Q3AS10_CHLCH